MKKVGDLFAELGFRPDASDGVKRAFIENLVRAAGSAAKIDARASEVKSAARAPISAPAARSANSASRKRTDTKQLSFDFDEGHSEDQSNHQTNHQSNAKRRSS